MVFRHCFARSEPLSAGTSKRMRSTGETGGSGETLLTLSSVPCLVIVLFVMTTGVNAPVRAQGLMGASSLVAVPTAEMWDDGYVVVGANGIPGFNLYDETEPPEFAVTGLVAIQFLPFVQVGLRIWRRSLDFSEKVHGIGDRSMLFRLQLLKERSWLPSVAIGARDPYSLDRRRFFAAYVVASKSIPMLSGIGLHAGYGVPGGSSVIVPLSGVFGGVSVKPHRGVRVIAEYDTRDVNMGVHVLPVEGLELTLALYRMGEIGGGLAYAFAL